MSYSTLFNAIAESVKSKSELSMVTCIYSDRREISQNPVCGFTLSFNGGKTRYINATDNSEQKIVTEVKLCLLAPLGAGGKRLSEVAEWVAQAVRESESYEEYSEIVITDTVYNETASIMSRDIVVSFCREAVTEPKIMVFVDGAFVEGMETFSVESKSDTEKEGELLNGYSTVDAVYYSINLSAEIPLKAPSEKFTLKLRTPEVTEEYTKCRLASYSCKYLDKDRMLFSYSIIATEKRV